MFTCVQLRVVALVILTAYNLTWAAVSRTKCPATETAFEAYYGRQVERVMEAGFRAREDSL